MFPAGNAFAVHSYVWEETSSWLLADEAVEVQDFRRLNYRSLQRNLCENIPPQMNKASKLEDVSQHVTNRWEEILDITLQQCIDIELHTQLVIFICMKYLTWKPITISRWVWRVGGTRNLLDSVWNYTAVVLLSLLKQIQSNTLEWSTLIDIVRM